MNWFKKDKSKESVIPIEINNIPIVDIRLDILSKSKTLYNKLKMLSSFFNNSILNDIVNETDLINEIFDKNKDLNYNKLEQYNYYYTDNIIELLSKLKKSREENIIILSKKLENINNKIVNKDIKTINYKLIENEGKKWTNYISEAIVICYRELSNNITNMDLININKINSEQNRLSFLNIMTDENIYYLDDEYYNSLITYEENEYYTSQLFLINKKLLGKLNKNVFNIEYKHCLCSDKDPYAKNSYIYLFKIKDTSDYFIFIPNKKVFKLIQSSDILQKIIINNSSYGKKAFELESILNIREQYQSDLNKQKSIYEPELLDIFTKYLNKIQETDMLNSLQEIDIDRKYLETILNTERFKI